MKQNNKPEEKITIDMPEVKDIPGQEKIRPPRIGEMRDVTASSDGEEGKGLVDNLNREFSEDDQLVTAGPKEGDPGSDVTETEKEMLDKTDGTAEDYEEIESLTLDGTDGEDPLNESSDPFDMGEDLDVPGAELDDDLEELGEGDEENNPYSDSDND